MNEDIEKIIEYFKNDNWYTIFNAEECNEEPYKLLLPTEVNQIIDYITQLQNNWNELKKCIGEWILYHSACEEDYKELNVLEDVESKMQELEQGKDE